MFVANVLLQTITPLRVAISLSSCRALGLEKVLCRNMSTEIFIFSHFWGLVVEAQTRNDASLLHNHNKSY